MKASARLLGTFAILAMAVGSLLAEPKTAMVVQVVSTEDSEGYNTKITAINAMIKAKTSYERLRRVWVGDLAGENSQGVFVVSVFPSAAAAGQFQDKLKDDAEVKAMIAELKSIRKLGPTYLYKAVRTDGMYDGGAVFNTSINCSDEDGYAQCVQAIVRGG